MKRLCMGPAFCVLFLSRAAHACTVCNSPTGHALRSGLWNGHFLQTFLMVAAPMPVLCAAVALVYLAMPDIQHCEANSDTLSVLAPELAA